MTGVRFCKTANTFEILVDTVHGERHEGYAATAQEAGKRLDAAVAKWRRHAAELAWHRQRQAPLLVAELYREPWELSV